MKRYIIKFERKIYGHYVVYANSEKEAIELIDMGMARESEDGFKETRDEGWG